MSTSSFTTSLLQTIQDIRDNVPPPATATAVTTASALQKWNDDIEQTCMETAARKGSPAAAASVIRKAPSSNNCSSNCSSPPSDSNGGSDDDNNKKNGGGVTTVEEVSICIHALILQIVEATYTYRLSEMSSSTAQSKDISNCSFQTTTSNNNSDANEKAMSIVEQISRTKYGPDKNTRLDNDSIVTFNLVDLLSQLIRASKNLIRWNRILLARAKAKRTSQTTGSGSGSGPEQCEIYGIDSCYRLCSSGMVKLYLTLLEMNSEPLFDDDGNDDDGDENDDEESKMNIQKARDELAKNSCVALFHSTYGEAIEPICKKSLVGLTSPSSRIYGINVVAQLLISSSSTQVTLALIKLLHNLVGSVPGIMNVIDSELKNLVQNESEMDDKNTQLTTTSSVETNLLSVLVSTLAWSIRSSPPFPGCNALLDRRSDIAIEIVRVLFALQHKHNSSYKKVNDSNPEVMTQLGVLIVDILHLPNKDKRVYDCKVSVLILLMDAPKEFSQFLFINHCVEPLLTILWLQLNELIVEKEGMIQGQSSAASILPILILLNKLSQANKSMYAKIKEAIFPAERDGELMTNYEQNHNNETSQTSYTNKSSTSSSSKSNPNNMNPIDAPHGTLRWKLIQLMTWTESNVKRCASELLWTLCNGDSKEFVARTGFGNAVHMLGIRGLVNIPK